MQTHKVGEQVREQEGTVVLQEVCPKIGCATSYSCRTRASHNHQNQLEKEKLGYTCHIHIATEKYIKANKKPEGFAEKTDKYNSLNGAFHCMVKDCNITGINTTANDSDHLNLFDS